MLRVGFQRQYGATSAFRMQRKRVRLAAAVDTAAEPDIVPDMPEMVDVMDGTLEDVISAVYSVLKQYTPCTMLPFTVRVVRKYLPEPLVEITHLPAGSARTAHAPLRASASVEKCRVSCCGLAVFSARGCVQRTFITIGIVCSLIVAVSQALAYAARYAAQKLTRDENDDDEVTTFSTTASLLKPLFVTLPIIGWLVALQRGFTGTPPLHGLDSCNCETSTC